MATKLSRARSLARLRLDNRTQKLRQDQSATMVPRGGWLRATRQALGMSLEDLAGRLGIARSTVGRIEESEQRGTIQLKTLQRMAAELNCDLAYALVPRVPLEKAVEDQRLAVARQLNRKVRTHMSLEGQDTEDKNLDQWRDERAVALVSDRQLWKQPR